MQPDLSISHFLSPIEQMCVEDGGVWDDTGSSLFVPGHCYDKHVDKSAPLGPGGLDANGNPAGSWANLDHWDPDGEPAGWANPRLWKEGFFKHEPTYRGMAVIGVALVAAIGGGVYLKKRKRNPAGHTTDAKGKP